MNSGDDALINGDYGDPSFGIDHDLRGSTFGGDGKAMEVEELANVEQKKNRDGRAQVRAEATAAKVRDEEGTVMVKHSR